MKMNWLAVVTLFAALGSGLMAGVFFTFSTFVMGALARLPSRQGIAAMQSINVVVLNSLFTAVFLATALVCVVLMITVWLHRGRQSIARRQSAVSPRRHLGDDGLQRTAQ